MTEMTIQKVPVKGAKKALCVLMGFQDNPFHKTIEEFENLMNQVGYSAGNATGSVRDFYRENSYGQMDLTVTVIGPYTAQNNESYYCSQTNDKGYQYFAKEAAQAADADIDYRDFANASGELETFHIIFAGYGAENGLPTNNYIWSHKWQLASPLVLDGVEISVYSCSPELRGTYGTDITYIGVICHELCHVFGADDYYDIDYSESGGNYPSTGDWDLMADGSWNDGGRTPAHINMFQKILYCWVTPVELTSPATLANVPNSAENPVAFVLKPHTNDEQYVLENRQKVGFDKNVPGSGLLIYHIHHSATTGNIDNRQHPQQAYVVAANATTAIPTTSVSSYGSVNTSTAPFTNVSGRDKFSDDSTPQMFRWNGSSGIAVTDKPITEITQSNGKIAFQFMGGSTEEVLFHPVTNLQSTIKKNTITLSWDLPENAVYPDSFHIYCENELIGELPVNKRSFSDKNKDTGTYNYYVKAIYLNGISEPEHISVNFEKICGYPVTNLNAEIIQDSILITWNAPEDTDEADYKYVLYSGETLIQKEIENTSFIYLPKQGNIYNFSVAAYTENCESEAVSVEVIYIKVIKQPENATVCIGHTHTLSVTVEPADLIYQWYYNGNPIENATSSQYTIPEMKKENEGVYHLIVQCITENGQVQGPAISASVYMIAIYPEDFEFTGIPEKLNSNETYTISLEQNSANPIETRKLQWDFSDNDLATIVPDEEIGNRIQLITGSRSGNGTLSVEISYSCGKITIEKAMEIKGQVALNTVSTIPFILYPNPVSDILTVSATAISSIIVIDVNGRKIYAGTNFNPDVSHTINTSRWSKGIYFVRVFGKDSVKTGRIVKN
jgi:M6 family metalloprotease-like protein